MKHGGRGREHGEMIKYRKAPVGHEGKGGVGIKRSRDRFVSQDFSLTILLPSGKLTLGDPGRRPRVEGMIMLRPQMHLIAGGRLYPKAWRQADQFRADRGKSGLPAWPSWCYLPMAAWYAIVSEGKGSLPLVRIGDVGRLAALGSWRVTQGISLFA